MDRLSNRLIALFEPDFLDDYEVGKKTVPTRISQDVPINTSAPADEDMGRQANGKKVKIHRQPRSDPYYLAAYMSDADLSIKTPLRAVTPGHDLDLEELFLSTELGNPSLPTDRSEGTPGPDRVNPRGPQPKKRKRGRRGQVAQAKRDRKRLAKCISRVQCPRV